MHQEFYYGYRILQPHCRNAGADAVCFHCVFPYYLSRFLYRASQLSGGVKRPLAVYRRAPFLASLALFTLCFAGIIIGFYPNIIPPSLTIHEAAAPRESLLFALYGTVVLIPLILGYTAYAYWVFRGKVDPAEGYH